MKKRFYYVLLFILLLSTSLVDANFGVASFYYETNPLKISPGETINTYFKIQNTIGNTTDLTIEVSIEEGGEIVTLIDGTSYNVLAGEQVTLNIKIQIPEDAEAGKEYNINVLFKPLNAKQEEGTLTFVVNVNRQFKVIVAGEVEITEPSEKEQPEKTSSTGFWVIIIISALIALTIIIIIIVYFMRKKQTQFSQSQDFNTKP